VKVVGYPQPSKAKSRAVLEAFVAGCGGRIADGGVLHEGVAAFYGVVGIEPLWHVARARGEFLYLDNAFLDCVRGSHFRAARNRLQEVGGLEWGRFKAMGIEVKPWRKDGKHVLVVMQSEHFMRHVAGWPSGADGWQDSTLRWIREKTDRQIIVRHWSRDKNERMRALRSDLQDAWCVVAHGSAAANEALLEGIPVFVTDTGSAAAQMACVTWNIEAPYYPENRCEWAARLAGSMWTLDEMRAGMAWRALT
jgi:hypothetical protein